MINFEIVPTGTLVATTIQHIRRYSREMKNYVYYVARNPKDTTLERHYKELNSLEDCIDILLREVATRNATIPSQYMKSYFTSMSKREKTLI